MYEDEKSYKFDMCEPVNSDMEDYFTCTLENGLVATFIPRAKRKKGQDWKLSSLEFDKEYWGKDKAIEYSKNFHIFCFTKSCAMNIKIPFCFDFIEVPDREDLIIGVSWIWDSELEITLEEQMNMQQTMTAVGDDMDAADDWDWDSPDNVAVSNIVMDMGKEIPFGQVWKTYKQMLEESPEYSEIEILSCIDAYIIGAGVPDIMDVMAVYDDIQARISGDDQKKQDIEDAWDNGPLLYRMIEDASKTLPYAEGLIEYWRWSVSKRNGIAQVIDFLQNTDAVFGCTIGYFDDSYLAFSKDDIDSDVEKILFLAMLKGGLAKALKVGAGIIIRVYEKDGGKESIYGLLAAKGKLQALSAEETEEAMGRQPDGSVRELKENEICRRIPIFF